MPTSNALHGLLIFASTFVLEDVAVLGAALLVVNGMVSLPWAVGSSFGGIWLGDVGLYLLALRFGRGMLERPWFKRFFSKKVDLAKSESWFQHHGAVALVLSRCIPGTRLPTYLVAGLLKVPVRRFLPVTALACAVWVVALFEFSYHVGMMAISGFNMFRSEAAKLAASVALAAVLAWAFRKLLKQLTADTLKGRFAKLFKWEFWPPVVFYAPVVFKYALLAIKYRSLTLPSLANPGMDLGGLIGESKYQTLAELAQAHPDAVVETHLIPFESVPHQIRQILQVKEKRNLSYPFVLKPDVGQRGFGFRIIHSDDDLVNYVERFQRHVLLQRYAAGPHEAGVLYFRFPAEDRGQIFSITDKVFPQVIGDGKSTLETLINKDARASLIADVYLQRFSGQRERILNAGETLRLVEAGNHCQGAIFLDGRRLHSEALADRIDEISRSLKGFFIGRYDLRYSSEELLLAGKDFQIIELNGVSSEATSIYDPRNSLFQAYKMLFRQWEVVFAIADQNRKGGLQVPSYRAIWRNWARHWRESAFHSPTDRAS